ncbi:MAG TPA: transglutaminase family protein [Polyangiaceae bacterium]
MHVRVHHDTIYDYDVPIALGPHVLRLSPRGGAALSSIAVVPAPVRQWVEIDALGNTLTQLVFQGETRQLRVDSHFELHTQPPARPLPPNWYLPLGPALATDGTRSGPPIAASVYEFADSVARAQGNRPLEFLDALAYELHARIDGKARAGAGTQLAADTLASARGACRDIATLYLEACRALGLTARFVSGYHAHPGQLSEQGDLHAWAEIELAGAGFVGWDPTLGTRAGEGHIAVAAGATQQATQPIEGSYTFQGSVLNSTLDFSLRIDTRR